MTPRSIQEISKDINEWRLAKGFFTPRSLQTEFDRDMMLGKLMLVTSEVSEAAEAVRAFNLSNFEEEIADAVIRLFDIAYTQGIELEAVIAQKMEVNWGRPRKHSKFCSL